MKQEEGKFIGHVFCPHCSSKDNVSCYTKDSGYDAICETPSCRHFFNEEELRTHGMLDELLDSSGKPKFTASKKEPITFDENVDLNKRVVPSSELENKGFTTERSGLRLFLFSATRLSLRKVSPIECITLRPILNYVVMIV